MTTITQVQQRLATTPAILVTASNGLSIAEGYHIFADDQNFKHYFDEFRTNYGIHNLIQGVFAQLPAPAHQRFMDQVHRYLIDDYQPTAVFADLKQLLATKDYFVVTSNADTHFQMNGFDPEKIWEIEGNFETLAMHDPEWQAQQARFNAFVQKYQDQPVIQLELGIGANNQMIKAPMMTLVAEHSNWQFVTLNMPDAINIAPEIQTRSWALPGDITQTLQRLRQSEVN